MGEVEYMIQSKIKDLSIQKKLQGKRILLFGYNIYVECINFFLNAEGYELYGVIDNDKEKQEKKIFDISVYAPEGIEWEEHSIVVLIASRHMESMIRQIRFFSDRAEIFILVDLIQWDKQQEAKEKFWLEENYEAKVQELCHGTEIYERVKQDELILVLDFSSIGDAFLIGLCFEEYQRLKTQKIKVIVGSKAACNVLSMFGIMSEAVFKHELNALSKFIDFCMDKRREEAACTWTFKSQYMCIYKGYSFSQFFPRYLFRLGDNYQSHFPSIWDTEMEEAEFIEKGLVKGKSVILAPYANTLKELPRQFWEYLTEKLLEKNYYVFTNIAGEQRPVGNSTGVKIPLEQLGSYLEYAGYFIALRSGLCDIAGRSLCKQIVIFRDNYIAPNSSEIMFFDLHSENISENAIQYVYDDNDFSKNIDAVMGYMMNESRMN